MSLRFQLISPVVGNLIIERADPIDINSLSQTIRRSKEINDGIVYEVILDVEFPKEGMAFVKSCYDLGGGIDAECFVTIYDRDPNARKWELYSTGQINFDRYEKSSEVIVVNIEQTGFQMRVLNLIDKDIDLETLVSENGSNLPASDAVTIPFHSKKILRSVSGISEDAVIGLNTFPVDTVLYLPVPIKAVINDFEDGYQGESYPFLFGDTEPSSVSRYDLKVKEVGAYSIDIKRIKNFISYAIFGGAGSIRIECLLKYGTPGALNTVSLYDHTLNDNSGLPAKDFDINVPASTHDLGNLLVKDEIYLYFKYTITANPFNEVFIYTVQNYQDGADKTQFAISGLTTFRTTNSKVKFLHDAIQTCIRYITNQTDCFYSELLGRIELGYEEDGAGAMATVTSGWEIREAQKIIDDVLTTVHRPIFESLKALIDLANSLYCVGFGFETMANGTKRLRLEKIDHFYDKDTRVISLGKVYNSRSRVDAKRFYNQVEYGFSGKIDIGQVNAIDEFNTIRRSTIPIINTKLQLKVASKFIGAGYSIEAQRRLSATTKDGKNDDNNFVIVVIRDGDSFRTKTGSEDDGYDQTAFSNVISPETSYNLDITPARCLSFWKKFIAAGLVKSFRKVVTFSSGEVNYLMTSKKLTEDAVVSENGNMDLSNIDPIWDNEVYSLTNVPVSRELFKLIKANPFGYIEFENEDEEICQGFLNEKGIEHDSNQGVANMELLKVFRR